MAANSSVSLSGNKIAAEFARGYKVYVGKTYKSEVGFIAEKEGGSPAPPGL